MNRQRKSSIFDMMGLGMDWTGKPVTSGPGTPVFGSLMSRQPHSPTKHDDTQIEIERCAYALDLYDSCIMNKIRSGTYLTACKEISSKSNTKSSKEICGRLRELVIRLGDHQAMDGSFFGALVNILKDTFSRDKDWDRKLVRLIHFYIRLLISPEGNFAGQISDSEIHKCRGISIHHLKEAAEIAEHETKHIFLPRRIEAYQTLAVINCAVTRWEVALCKTPPEGNCDEKITCQNIRSEIQVSLTKFLEEYNNTIAIGGDSLGDGDSIPPSWLASRRPRKGEIDHKEQLGLSRAVYSAIRRNSKLKSDMGILTRVLDGCRSTNSVTARHAFAILLEQAKVDAKGVASGIYPLLQPTTVAAAGNLDIPNLPNLVDSLACVYYLRILKFLVFAPELKSESRLDFYRTIANSVSDMRHRVALEAIQCLLDHERAWTLLVYAQRESRDTNLFRRVIDALLQCLAASSINTSGPTSGVPNWPLAHAACRAARAIGRTLQKAMSYEAMSSRGVPSSVLAPDLLFFGGNLGGVSPSKNADYPLLLLPPTPTKFDREETLLDLLDTPPQKKDLVDAAEASNMASIRDLCSSIWNQGFMDCDHQHVRSLALEAMFLLVPDPSPNDPELQELWTQLQIKLEACPNSLPETSLVHLVRSLLVRVDCSEASRNGIVPIVLDIAESFLRQIPSHAISCALVQAWTQCITYGVHCCENVLQSVYRILDSPLPNLIRDPMREPSKTARDWLADSRQSSSSSQFRKMSNSQISRIPNSSAVHPRTSSFVGEGIGAQFSSDPGSEKMPYSTASQIPNRTPNLSDVNVARAATQNLRQLAYWFLGHHCCELTGIEECSSVQNTETLWGIAVPDWTSSNVRHTPKSISEKQLTKAENMVNRLCSAATFEDFLTRYAATEALCGIALRIPDPIRLNVYLFLRAIVNSEFNVTHLSAQFGPEEGESEYQKKLMEIQMSACESLQNASAIGITELIHPVLNYLDFSYATAAKQTPNQVDINTLEKMRNILCASFANM